MLYSFIRPIAQGRSELLYGCAGVTFLIPLVDLWVNHKSQKYLHVNSCCCTIMHY